MTVVAAIGTVMLFDPEWAKEIFAYLPKIPGQDYDHLLAMHVEFAIGVLICWSIVLGFEYYCWDVVRSAYLDMKSYPGQVYEAESGRNPGIVYQPGRNMNPDWNQLPQKDGGESPPPSYADTMKM